MSMDEDASQGVHLAGELLAAFGDGDEAEVLRLVNGAESAGVRWACAYLLRFAYESLSLATGDEARAMEIMRDWPAHAAGDAVDTAVRVILQRAADEEGV